MNIIDQDSSYAATPSPLSPPAQITGTGALVEEEHDLLKVVQRQSVAAEERQAMGLVNILEFHAQEIATVLSLIEARQKLYPHPRRFVPWEGKAHLLRWSGVPLADEGEEPLQRLRRLHQMQVESLEGLLAVGQGKDAGQSMLQEAKIRHEEMIWMLTALIAEDGIPRFVSAERQTSEPDTREAMSTAGALPRPALAQTGSGRNGGQP